MSMTHQLFLKSGFNVDVKTSAMRSIFYQQKISAMKILMKSQKVLKTQILRKITKKIWVQPDFWKNSISNVKAL